MKLNPLSASTGLCLLFGAAAPSTVTAEETKPPKVIPFVDVKMTEPVVFDKHVFPILAEKCTTCHDKEGGLAEGGLDLMTVEAILKGGKKGAAITLGKGAESRMIKLSSMQAKPYMPPDDEEPLTPQELSLIKLWIDQGAKPGEDLNPAEKYYQEVVLGELPPGVHPVYALDMDAAATTLVAGRANQVFVYDLPTGGLRAQLTGHQDVVQSVRLSPNGQWIASGGYQKVLLWKVPQAVELAQLAGHGAAVRSLAVSRDGTTVATGSDDKTVRLWDLESRKQLRALGGHGAPVNAVAFSPDKTLVATGCSDAKVRLFQVADGKLLHALEGHTQPVLAVAFSSDGRWIASGGKDNVLKLWDVHTRLHPPEPPKAEPEPKAVDAPPKKEGDAKPKSDDAKPQAKKQSEVPAAKQETKPAQPKDRELKGHSKPIRALAFTKESLLSGSEDGTIITWNTAEGTVTRKLTHGEPVAAVAVSSDGSLVATGSAKNNVVVWKAADGAKLRTITGTTGPVNGLSFGPDAKQLAVAATDNSLRTWDPLTGQLLHVLAGHTGPVNAVALSGGHILSVSDDKSVRLWSANQMWESPDELGPFAERVIALAFSPDSAYLATGGGVPAASGEVQLWDVAKQEMVREFEQPHSDTVYGLAFSPDAKLLASSAADKFLKVFEVSTGKMVKSFEGHTHHVLGVDWKSDGKQLATAGADNAVKFWNYETGEQIRSAGGHGKQVTGVTWIGTTDRVITSCADRNVRKVHSGNGRVERNFGGAADFLFCVDVSADGKTVASGGQDGKILIWDENGKLLRTFEVPQSLVKK